MGWATGQKENTHCVNKISAVKMNLKRIINALTLTALICVCARVCVFHSFEHSNVIMNMKSSSHGFLFHGNINRKKTKAKLITHHNEKN